MAVKSLAQSSLSKPQRHRSMLAGYETNMFHHLETIRLSSSASSVEFTNLGQYSDFQHLQLRMVGRSDKANNVADTNIRLNSDAGSNYSWHSLRGTGSGVFSGNVPTETYMYVGEMAGGTFTTDGFGASIVDFLDFASSNKNTTIRAFHGLTGNHTKVRLISGFWNNTAAVTTIDIFPNTDSFVSGSRFSLYGLKARA